METNTLLEMRRENLLRKLYKEAQRAVEEVRKPQHECIYICFEITEHLVAMGTRYKLQVKETIKIEEVFKPLSS